MKAFFYLSVLMFACAVSYATGGDTTKVKYDLNDPRNPDCPCHKYQQLADEEYKKQLSTGIVMNASKEIANEISEAKEGAATTVSAIVAKNGKGSAGKKNTKLIGTKRFNHSVFSKHSDTQRRTSQPKKRKIRFGKRDQSRCTHW